LAQRERGAAKPAGRSLGGEASVDRLVAQTCTLELTVATPDEFFGGFFGKGPEVVQEQAESLRREAVFLFQVPSPFGQ
jgi:hypothetical protein